MYLLFTINEKLPFDRDIRFTYHPNLFSIALILYTEGFYIKKNRNPYYLKSILNLGWTGRNRLHVICSALATYSSAIAFYQIYTNKNENGKDHFKTWHGVVGIITILGKCFNLNGI